MSKQKDEALWQWRREVYGRYHRYVQASGRVDRGMEARIVEREAEITGERPEDARVRIYRVT